MKIIPGWLKNWFQKETAVEAPQIAPIPDYGFAELSLAQLSKPVELTKLPGESPLSVTVGWRRVADIVRTAPGQVDITANVIATASSMDTIAAVVKIHGNKGLPVINVERDILAHLVERLPVIKACAENYDRQAQIYYSPNVHSIGTSGAPVKIKNPDHTTAMAETAAESARVLNRFAREFETLVMPLLPSTAFVPAYDLSDDDEGFRWPHPNDGPTRRPF